MSPIAIIGIGCRFPQARGLGGFWRLLRDGVDAVTETPAHRWDAAAYYDPRPQTPGKINTRWGAYLEDVDQFDPQFFGISPREAVRMDPQQRLALEITQEALEDAGIPAPRLAGSATGVYVGFSSPEYYMHYVHNPQDVDEYTNSGNTLSMIANRMSYVFDLRGPSMSLDTACSSSLTAVHLACRSLQSGETSLALAGGVNLMFAPLTSIGFSQLMALSPDGRCRSFDAAANGYVRGEGIGIVILKRLQDALADGDRIHAVVRGVATNSDGRSNGITAPNRFAQEAVLRAAYRDARVSPGEIQYVEAHGSGTLLGDPIEAAALGTVLADDNRKTRCAIGSVKTNLGHAEAAAGVAGLIKTILAMQHGIIPASLHFRSPNPHIDFERLPLSVQATLGEWPAKRGTRLAGISSFGYGGSNAHLVLNDAPVESGMRNADRGTFFSIPQSATRNPQLPASCILTISGRTPEALADNAWALAAFLQGDGANGNAPLDAVCYTASACRAHYEHRLGIAAASKCEMVEAIEDFLASCPRRNVFAGRRPPSGAPKVAFVYRGQQGDFAAAQRRLYETYPVFRTAFDECLQSPVLTAPAGSPSSETASLASRFAYQYAATRLWNSWGVKPHAVVGHWLGHGVAACIAGEMSPAEALEQIAAYVPQGETPNDHQALLTELEELHAQGVGAAIEIGDSSSTEELRGPLFAGRMTADSPWFAHGSTGDANEDDLVLMPLAWLYSRGVDIDWRAWYGTTRTRIALPTYGFQRKRYWISDQLQAHRPEGRKTIPECNPAALTYRPLKRLSCAAPSFEFAVSAGAPAWSNDHRVQGLPIFPAAGVWEAALAAASEISAGGLGLANVELARAVVLSAERPYTLQLAFLAGAENDWGFQLFGRSSDDAPWTRHARGRAVPTNPTVNGAALKPMELESLRRRLVHEETVALFYQDLARRGLEYGPTFQGVKELWRGAGEALALLELPPAADDGAAHFGLHPALLDAALQAIGGAMPAANSQAAAAFVPTRVEWLRIQPGANRATWSVARLRPVDEAEQTFAADVAVYDVEGQIVVEVVGLRFERFGDTAGTVNRGTTVSTAGDILALSGEGRKAGLLDYLRTRVADALGLEASQLPVDQPLYDLGLDSLVIFKLAAQIEGELGVEIPMRDLATGPTLAEFTELMTPQLKE
jgi:acyl transferase domain-containing protein